MSLTKKTRSPLFWMAILAITSVTGVVGWYSYRGYKGMQRRREMMKDVLPTFKDPNPQAKRAPATKALGLHIGFTSLAEAKAFTQKHLLTCKDTSVRAMMKRYRMKKLAELKKKGPDAVSNASILKYRSKKEQNPQVRLSCERSDASLFQDGPVRPKVPGRLLMIFDSAKHPMRHISLSYNARHPTGIKALGALLDAYTRRYGKPHKSEGALPDLAVSHPKNAILLKKYHSIGYRWQYADLRIYLKVMSLGTWVSVLEELEVPLGIRPDAPALKK